MPRPDFEDIKRTVTFEEAVELLKLKMRRTKPNQLRGQCPCGKGNDRALCLTERSEQAKGGFYCWGSHASGSIIDFVMHVRKCGDVEAANLLIGNVGTVGTVPGTRGTVPQNERAEDTSGFAPLAYLEAEHPAIDALGFDPEFCKRHGIGYSPKGMMRGTVAIPFRDENGTLLGYIGVEDCKIPASFTANIVPFAKRA